MMKACTDIKQSKKLAEILPIESSDMHYSKHPIENYYSPMPLIGKCSKIQNEIPCWSLAALLKLIPNWTMDKTDKINLTCNPYYHCESCYSVVDAAFEMIVWLKENDKL